MLFSAHFGVRFLLLFLLFLLFLLVLFNYYIKFALSDGSAFICTCGSVAERDFITIESLMVGT